MTVANASMEDMFGSLLDHLRASSGRGLRTDDSVLLVYPPERELDFRDQLVHRFIPQLDSVGLRYRHIDLTDFIFIGLGDDEIADLCEQEFDDYAWMTKGLAKRIEMRLEKYLGTVAAESPGVNLLVSSTVSLHPLVRWGETLKSLRDLPSRIILAFPGEDRGGKLHFMGQPDGSNYLATKIVCQ